MGGTPGPLTRLRELDGGWRREALVGVGDLDSAAESSVDMGADDLIYFAANHQHDPVETGRKSIEDGVVHDRLAARTYGDDLFEPTESASHAGGEDDQILARSLSR